MLCRDGKYHVKNGEPLVTMPSGRGACRLLKERLVLCAEEWFADDREERVDGFQVIFEKSISQLLRRHFIWLHRLGNRDVKTVEVVAQRMERRPVFVDLVFVLKLQRLKLARSPLFDFFL